MISVLVMMTPSSGFYYQNVYDQALSLEKEVLKHARITATKKAIEAIEEGPLHATLYYSKDKKEVIISNEPIVELKLEGDKISVTVDGETIDTVRLNPNHAYVYTVMRISSGIPVITVPTPLLALFSEHTVIELNIINNKRW
ncbi:hypothetical protein [Methanopyrus sp. KOL6]|uniref:hypothetical protein n=1 Tax=Methanopyrus sp. KOL6 TaxID=1937004 RepID=UPI0012FB1BAA|nr:hypothetical protein [Methanopyrus sp. KOL6]